MNSNSCFLTHVPHLRKVFCQSPHRTLMNHGPVSPDVQSDFAVIPKLLESQMGTHRSELPISLQLSLDTSRHHPHPEWWLNSRRISVSSVSLFLCIFGHVWHGSAKLKHKSAKCSYPEPWILYRSSRTEAARRTWRSPSTHGDEARLFCMIS